MEATTMSPVTTGVKTQVWSTSGDWVATAEGYIDARCTTPGKLIQPACNKPRRTVDVRTNALSAAWVPAPG
ncbi:hypothetical protein TPB0596_20280 [Tsukamurella pulmonis]|nr:hypothetical protein TPB0596_20280 [Tsukamurella pulmonis]